MKLFYSLDSSLCNSERIRQRLFEKSLKVFQKLQKDFFRNGQRLFFYRRPAINLLDKGNFPAPQSEGRLQLIFATMPQKVHDDRVTLSHSSGNLRVPPSQPTPNREQR